MKPGQRVWGLRLGKQWILVGLLGLSLLTGCATPSQNPYLYTGAGLGAALGAGIGAAANHRNPWKGAAIGALLGGAGGGVAGEVYGRSQTPSQPQQQQGYYQQPQQEYYPPQQGSYQPAPLLWASAQLSRRSSSNRIPPAGRLKTTALVSESPQGFFYGKIEKFNRSRWIRYTPGPAGSAPLPAHCRASASATCRITFMTLSGLREMESMPQETRNSANSG